MYVIFFVDVTVLGLFNFSFRNVWILDIYLPPRMLNLVKNTTLMCIAVIQALTPHANERNQKG